MSKTKAPLSQWLALNLEPWCGNPEEAQLRKINEGSVVYYHPKLREIRITGEDIIFDGTILFNRGFNSPLYQAFLQGYRGESQNPGGNNKGFYEMGKRARERLTEEERFRLRSLFGIRI